MGSVGLSNFRSPIGIGLPEMRVPKYQTPDWATAQYANPISNNNPGGFDYLGLGKTLLGAAGLGGGIGSLFKYGQSGMNFKPSFTPEMAKSTVQSAGIKALSDIGRQASLARTSAASDFVGRGLGSSGAAIGDIADVNARFAPAIAGVNQNMATQLAQLLMGIDQQNMQYEAMKSKEGQDIWGTVGDLLLTAGMAFI